MATDLSPHYPIISAREKIIYDDTPFGSSFGGLRANAQSTQQGYGDNIYKVSEKGIHLGAAEFDDSPFSVTMAGVLHATSGTFSGDITGASGTFSGTITAETGNIGGFDIGADYIRDEADSFGLASTVTGGDDVRGWAGATFANRATAPFRWTEAGAITCSNITITGGTVEWSTVVGTTNAPDNNADVTSANTSNDTSNVNSVTSSQVQDRAETIFKKIDHIGQYDDGLTSNVSGTGVATRSLLTTKLDGDGTGTAQLY